MNKVAEYTEEEFDEQVKQATAYIEPAMVVTLGVSTQSWIVGTVLDVPLSPTGSLPVEPSSVLASPSTEGPTQAVGASASETKTKPNTLPS